jgi:hypothetical protein
MRLFFPVFFLCSFSFFSQTGMPVPRMTQLSKKIHAGVKKAGKKKFKVEIIITQTFSYCGGAEPDPDLLKEMGKASAFAGKKIYIKQGEKNSFNSKIVLEAVADKDGKIEFSLPPGKYFIVDELKKDTSYYKTLLKTYKTTTASYSAIDPICLKKWYEKPELIIEIKNADVKDLTLNFHQACSWEKIPCAQYSGPMPP